MKENQVSLEEIAKYTKIMPPLLGYNQPAITAAFLLAVAKANDAMILGENGDIIGSAGSVSLIEGILQWRRELWKNMYVHTLGEIVTPVKVFYPGAMLSDYLSCISTSKFSYSVYMDNRTSYLITPLTLLRFFHDHGMIENAPPYKYASKLVSAEPSLRILELLELMVTKWIRKVVIGKKLITDRSLAECYLFSMYNLGKLAHDPDEVLDNSINDMQGCLTDPPTFSLNDDAVAIAEKILSSDSQACVSSNYDLILTPYDLAVKPLLQKYPQF
ncbi:MAG: hypothetical protein JRN26_05945 [Nitrososphaerota archaeon]|jgi:hypothetical protein|nr:hypothetical protein [Nitrososphaerota archaeon]MDG6926989.1 hypothetical protein [Nitrososphaerota archaeon]MDG6930450.1 hypothetical protein [Nitrososphaerota archaeon]MDG6931491.1 hypothetical protein [Nitrososphaerota archaeon]MDG6936404.1 hypothetical protein [Nitrososphaerota archaeon]